MTTSRQISRAQAWVLAARVPTLPAALVPVLVGSAVGLAHGRFRPFPFLAALLAALLIQVGTNLANDYFDHQKGADTSARVGPLRVTQSGLIAPATVWRATLLTFGLAALLGLYLIVAGGWPILLIGVLSIAAGLLYTGGPWPLGYNGLGDLFVFLFFGLVAVLGTEYLHTASPSALGWLCAVAVGALATNILVCNNLRDIETDRLAGKRTLAVLLGRRATRVQYLLLLLLAYAMPAAIWLSGLESAWVLLSWLSLPLAVPLLQLVFRAEGRALIPALKGTARLQLAFGLLLSLGLVL